MTNIRLSVSLLLCVSLFLLLPTSVEMFFLQSFIWYKVLTSTEGNCRRSYFSNVMSDDEWYS